MTEKFKNAWFWVAGIIVALFGSVYLLLTRNRSLKEELEESKAASQDVALKTQETQADAVSADAVAEYERARSEWLAEYYKSNPLARPSDVPPGDSSRR